jgi:hypothetical protein
VGIGTYSTSGPTLARTTVLSNSSGNTSPITLAAGTKSIFLTYPAEKSVNLDASDNVSPLGTVSSGVWQGSTVGVAYGGTGVTASSGANSVVLRDSNQNIAVNRVNQSNTNTTAAGGTTALSAASSYIHTLVGTGGQTYTLPDATTLTTGVAFVFNNLATGTLTVANYAGTTIGTVPSGGAAAVFLTLNSTTGGTWDLHAYLPEGVTFGTNAFNLGTSIVSGGTWQGGTIQTGYGGTGLTSYTSGGAVYANSSTTLTSGTLPTSAGGTGNTSGQAASTTASATFNSGGAGGASGSTFNGSGALTVSYNTIGAPSTTGTNATGTWGISISGNAATATTATTATNQSGGTINATTMVSSGRYTRNTTGGINSTSARFALNTSQQADYHIASSVNGSSTTNTQEYGITFSPSGGSTQAGILISENGSDGTAIGFFCTNSYAAGPQLRASIDPVGNFNTAGAISQNGSQVLTAANYNSYAPTLTGGGASGTWGINITGSAGSAPGYLPLSGGTMTGSLSFAQSANINFGSSTNEAGPWTISVIGSGGATPATKGTGFGRNLIVKAGNSDNGGGLAGGDLYLRAGAPTAPATSYGVVYLSDDGGFTQAGGSLRAPIFYDSNNTGYYVDPSSVSSLSSIVMNSAVSNNANGTRNVMPGGGSYVTQASVVNGAIVITLPATLAPMLKFRVSVYTYDGLSFDIYCGGHTSGGTWYNTFAYMGTANRSALNVRFTYGGGAVYVYIGELGSSWSYPQVFITDVQVGFADTGYTNWDDNWSIGFNASTYNNISATHTVNPPTQSGNNTGAVYAPIYYDSNDTNYYFDGASVSRLNAAMFIGPIRRNSSVAGWFEGTYNNVGDNSGNSNPIYTIGSAYNPSNASLSNMYGVGYAHPNFWGASRGSGWGLYTAAAGSFTGVFGAQGGFNTWIDGYGVSTASWRAPIFYDSDDTGYYLNPNGSSLLYGIVLSGNMYFRPNTWIQMDGSYGIYWPTLYGTHLYPNASSTYTQLQIDGSKNSYSGMYISHSAVNGMMYDGGGNGGVYREANGRWFWYHNVGNNCMGVGTSTAPSTYGIYVVKGGYFDGRVDGTIFYDANNTGYYLDPTSTTSIRTVGSWRADSAAWDGEFSGKLQYHSSNWYFQYAGSILFRNSGGSNVFTVDQSGNAVASGNVTAYSDARIKENVVTIDSALDKVLKLRGVYYNKIGNPERRVGVIAQEIETVLPEVVRSVSDTNPSTGQTQELLAVDYGNIAGLLIEATKEQNQEVVDLRNRVAQLESLIHKLIGD